LFYFSKPVAERNLLKSIHNQTIKSIVEIGVGDGSRTKRILEVAGWKAGEAGLKYTGIDLFEGRPEGTPGMSLKEAFHALKTPNVKMQFVPGDPYQALARTANMLANTDLLIVSSGLDEASLARAWMYVPRMLHANTLVYLHERTSGTTTSEGKPVPGTENYKRLTQIEVERLAAAGSKRSSRRAA